MPYIHAMGKKIAETDLATLADEARKAWGTAAVRAIDAGLKPAGILPEEGEAGIAKEPPNARATAAERRSRRTV